jgi:hypothetical protein
MLNVAPPQKKRRIWLRILVWLVVCLLLLLVASYFAVTSPAILKSVVLPRLSTALRADVTVTNIVFKPFQPAAICHSLRRRTWSRCTFGVAAIFKSRANAI